MAEPLWMENLADLSRAREWIDLNMEEDIAWAMNRLPWQELLATYLVVWLETLPAVAAKTMGVSEQELNSICTRAGDSLRCLLRHRSSSLRSPATDG